MSKAFQTLEQIKKMEDDLAEAKRQIGFIKKYVEERIRVDNLPDGFAKGYDGRMVKYRNTEVLLAISMLEQLF